MSTVLGGVDIRGFSCSFLYVEWVVEAREAIVVTLFFLPILIVVRSLIMNLESVIQLHIYTSTPYLIAKVIH